MSNSTSLVVGLFALVPLQEPAAVELRMESLDGLVRTVTADELPLVDPRRIGATFLRPVARTRVPEEALATSAIPTTSGRARVELTSGDFVFGRIEGGGGEVLSLELVGGTRLGFAIEELANLLFAARLPEDLAEPLEPAVEGDRLYRRSGVTLDKIDGTVDSFTAEGVRFDSVLGLKLFPWSEIAALYIEVFEDGPPKGAAEGTPIRLDLVDGSRLRGTLARLDAKTVRMLLPRGSEVEIGLRNVLELAVDDGRARFLSDLEAAAEEGAGTPFDDGLGMRWPHERNRSVVGTPLVAGRRFAHGIGAHAPTRIVWELDGSWREFRGSVAIDDSVTNHGDAARGSVVFRVFGDDTLLWESDVVRGGESPRSFQALPVAGVTRLVLELDPVDDFAGDRGNWLRPLLTK